MKPSTNRSAAWSLCISSIVLVVIAGVLRVASGTPLVSDWGTVYNTIAFVPVSFAFPIVGALIAVRRPGNLVGWLILLTGLANSMSGFATEYGLYLIGRGQLGSVGGLFVWFGYWSWVLYIAPIGVFLVLLFPDGKLPSHRWRPVMWAGVLSMTLASLGEALYPGPLAAPPNDVVNPFGVEDAGPLFAILDFGSLLLPICFVAAGASMFVRWRRSRGVERQQLKWFVYAAALLAAVFAAEMAIVFASGDTGKGTVQRILEDLVTLGLAAPAIAAGIAILRYRLYDIDIIINRTLVYGSLTVVLAFVYVIGVVGIGGLLREVTGQRSNNLVVAASTLAVAALFRPARSYIQGLIDRYFYRRKYDAVRTLDGFSARMRDEVALDALIDDLLGTVQETVQPRHVSMWLVP